jgi:hypothetical protein
MENVKDQVVTTTETTEQTTNEQTTIKPEPFGFTQEQLDEVVAKRLARERDAVAKKLGVETFDAIDGLLESYKTTQSEKAELMEKYNLMTDTALDKDIRLTALLSGVIPEHLDRVVKLAIAEIENQPDEDELNIAATIDVIVNEFPMFKNLEVEPSVRKIGQEPSTKTNSKTDIDRYNSKYDGSKYYNKP